MADHFIADGDVFLPERLSEVIFDMAYDQLAILNTPAVTELQATFTNGGRQVTFPVFNGLQGDFESLDHNDTAATDPTVNYADMTTETVDVVSKVIDIGMKGCTLEDAFKSGQFNLVDAVLEEVANKLTAMLDGYLVTLAEATDLEYDYSGVGTGLLSRKALIGAGLKWGDRSQQPAVLAVHSKPYGDVLDEVKDYNIIGSSSVSLTGQVPVLMGRPLIISDRISFSTPKYTNLLLAAGALGFSFHRQLSYTVIRQVGDRYIHEFVVRYFGKLRRRNGKNLAVKLLTK
jgi:hypothetical protein